MVKLLICLGLYYIGDSFFTYFVALLTTTALAFSASGCTLDMDDDGIILSDGLLLG